MHSLVIETVTKRYGTTLALDDVSFVVDPGEFVALLGPSGAGKSTLFRCVTRLVAPDTGVVRVLGRDMSALGGQELRLARRDVGLIFQQFNLIGRLSAMDNVLAGRMGHASTLRVMLRRFTHADRQLALAALDRVGLLERAGQRADSLSGGQQQRVAIARVLAQQARLLLADEPVSSLDPQSAENVLGILRSIARETGIAVVCALHQVDLARRYADRVVALRGGRKLLDASVNAFDQNAFQELYGAHPG
ncbi:MAG: phosphonate ABC transporter ATP-binding protein [Roseomonas sp.]|nr:phosphonate ABC transporter ATP-binding protein [Roseomonas sp.]MCA3292443.1 phosphonate ABC transporter ATP-binding protein [Roseomonas sp.]MCA3295904.1 phosphonate ABC transporter ATP-binding protein [Roseomonas sp.]MCA3311200.1 phosphonate ABC transporter ATP-binding protein [Roseomonas sp.]